MQFYMLIKVCLSSRTGQFFFAQGGFAVCRLVGVVIGDTANGARGLWFDSRAGQIGNSVANGSPPLRCYFEIASPQRYAAEMDPATRYTLRCNTASIC